MTAEEAVQVKNIRSQIPTFIEHIFFNGYQGSWCICDNSRSSWYIIDQRNLSKRISWFIINLLLFFSFLQIILLNAKHAFQNNKKIFSNISFFKHHSVFLISEKLNAIDEFVEGVRPDIKGRLYETNFLYEMKGTLMADRMRSFSWMFILSLFLERMFLMLAEMTSNSSLRISRSLLSSFIIEEIIYIPLNSNQLIILLILNFNI